jgi:hypothetical protein
VNLRERHSHTFKDPHKTERCDAAQLLAAGDALAHALAFHNQTPTGMVRVCDPACIACAALAAWKKATDGK